jgi:hypothetical protein
MAGAPYRFSSCATFALDEFDAMGGGSGMEAPARSAWDFDMSSSFRGTEAEGYGGAKVD